jgi:hypothetical protein
MTEEEWRTCESPGEMWIHLGSAASHRKLRLFASACCRRLAPHFKDERSARLIDVSDRFADGIAEVNELNAAFDDGVEAQEAIHWEDGGAVDQASAETVLGLRAELYLDQVFEGIGEVAGTIAAAEARDQIYTPGRPASETDADRDEVEEQGKRKEAAALARIMRDIFGNPFQPVTFDPAWRTSDAVALTRQMYDSREFSAMPILADALQDAGCDNDDILSHCRATQLPHVRGCWVVDLVLDKA